MFSLSLSPSRRACASLLALLAFPAVALAARPNADDRPAPYPGGSHQQWVREVFTWEQGLPPAEVAAVAQTREGKVYVTSGGTLLRRSGDRWEKEKGPLGVTALYVPEKTVSLPSEEKKPPAIELMAGAEDGVWLLVSGRWRKDGAESPAGATVFTQAPDESLWTLVPAGKSAGLWRRTAEGWGKGPVLAANMGKVRDFAGTSDGALYAATDQGLFILEREGQWAAVAPQEGTLLSADIRALEALGPHYTLIATNKGFNITNGRRGWQKYTGAEGLPIEEITQAVVEPSGATWLGTPHGVVRWHEGRWNYFAGPRWLPDDKVLTLAPGENGVWVGTAKGLARLYTRRLSLVRKAELYQRDLEKRNRREGFVTVMRLRQPGDFTGAIQEISDNDGLWTAMYAASQVFRYATNGSNEARDQARRSMQALLRLESITGIPGFPARAISSLGEPGHETRSKGEWHPSPSEPNYMWKGDTSSDEIVGHYFAWYVYHELAADKQEKAQIRAACKRVTDHILDNNFQLIDKDGKPTTWGIWTPERLNDDPKWENERGLNSLEILSHLRVAMHIVGDQRYAAAYRDLIETHHYALNAMKAKVVPPGEVNHSDDELEFLSWYPLLQLETDAGLRSLYTAGIRRSWTVERPEASPLWNFIYGASTGEPCDVDAAVQSLRDMPLDLVNWPVRNSIRADLKLDPQQDRFQKAQLLQPLPWTERPMHKWNGNPQLLDGGSGLEEEDQTVWLLPYWLGRYHKIID